MWAEQSKGSTVRVTRDLLGAWIIKCHPTLTDLDALLPAAENAIRRCVSDNYRSALLAPGQRVLLWLSGPSRRRGLWGSGWVTGEATYRAAPPANDEPTGDHRGPAAPPRLSVPLVIHRFTHPVPADEISAVPDLRALEVLRQPFAANPSWISRPELRALNPLLPPWAR